MMEMHENTFLHERISIPWLHTHACFFFVGFFFRLFFISFTASFGSHRLNYKILWHGAEPKSFLHIFVNRSVVFVEICLQTFDKFGNLCKPVIHTGCHVF